MPKPQFGTKRKKSQMAKDSGIGTIIGLGIAGVGVWWLGDVFGWWGATTTATTTATPAGIVPASTPIGTVAATVTMQGSPQATINNALQASFVINGSAPQTIAVIPGGDAYNTSGADITSQLAVIGVTPAQLYAMMSAAYVAPAATPVASTPVATTSTTTSTTGSPSPVSWRNPNIAPGAVGLHPVIRRAGMGASVNYRRVS